MAAVFQLTEIEQTVIARTRKIGLNFCDPEPEAVELVANCVVALILTKQNDEWINARHQQEVWRLPEVWCACGARVFLPLCHRAFFEFLLCFETVASWRMSQ